MNYAFTFDASACSGCKACQEACKDKNGLPVGVLWRRVIEIAGGEWKISGSAWENSIFAYNLSLACNHCSHPKCAGVCPTNAYAVRSDGIVILDSTKCMGCGYCAWACPYSAPQYDRTGGIMTKCDFCYDRIDAGLPPTCVAACPLRVLDYTPLENGKTIMGSQNLWQLPATEHPFPLPNFSRTEPHLVIKPHAGMKYPLEKLVCNREEVFPPGSIENSHRVAAFHELPLVSFTLLTQMAVGMAVFGLVLRPIPMPIMLVIGILLAVGGLTSFLHLGRKRNAWRSVIHLRKSWLSREILMTGLFGIAWALTVGWEYFKDAPAHPWPMALLGICLVYTMSRVYLLRAVPSWNTWRTLVSFYLSAVILGVLGTRLFMPLSGWELVAGFALAAELVLALTAQPAVIGAAGILRLVLLSLGILGGLFTGIFPQVSGTWMVVSILIITVLEEVLGRWQFYARRTPFPILPK